MVSDPRFKALLESEGAVMLQPANDPDADYKALVQQGYDVCAAAYEHARRKESIPQLEWLIQCLSRGVRVLDIGCGSGVPVAQALAQRFRVTGVDISGEQIRRARLNVSNGEFIHGDIMAVDFPPAQFDAVVAFFSIFHLPREAHPELLRRMACWLKPNGYLMITASRVSEEAYTEDDFFDVTMYWSNYGLEDYQKMLAEAGFRLIEMVTIGTPPDQHPLMFAQLGGAEGQKEA
jgi:SAM-dependent methyltransferase